MWHGKGNGRKTIQRETNAQAGHAYQDNGRPKERVEQNPKEWGERPSGSIVCNAGFGVT